MYSGKETQGQSEIPEGHCIKEGKLFHNRIHTLIQSRIYKKQQKCSDMGIFSYL